jgi:hypothetical protein
MRSLRSQGRGARRFTGPSAFSHGRVRNGYAALLNPDERPQDTVTYMYVAVIGVSRRIGRTMDGSILDRRKALVRTAIIGAFAQVAYPGDNNIATPDLDIAMVSYIAGPFKKQHRQTISVDVLAEWASSLYILSKEAVHYFLPAFLLASLDEPYCSSDLAAQTIHYVTGVAYRCDVKDPAFLAIVGRFSPWQRNAIRVWLELMIPLTTEGIGDPLFDIIRHALDAYWANPERDYQSTKAT